MSYQQPPQGPPPPGSQPGYPGPAPPGPAQQGRLRGTRRLMWGIILMALGLIGGIIGAIAFGASAANQFQSFAEDAYDIQEPVQLEGMGDNQWYIYQPEVAAGSITCEVIDETGRNVVEEQFSSSVQTNDFSYESMQSFTTAPSSSYQIACTDYPILIAGVAPIGSIFGAIGSAVAGFFVFAAGLVLTIIGAVVRSKAKRQTVAPGPYSGGPQHYGQQPPQV